VETYRGLAQTPEYPSPERREGVRKEVDLRLLVFLPIAVGNVLSPCVIFVCYHHVLPPPTSHLWQPHMLLCLGLIGIACLLILRSFSIAGAVKVNLRQHHFRKDCSIPDDIITNS